MAAEIVLGILPKEYAAVYTPTLSDVEKYDSINLSLKLINQKQILETAVNPPYEEYFFIISLSQNLTEIDFRIVNDNIRIFIIFNKIYDTNSAYKLEVIENTIK